MAETKKVKRRKPAQAQQDGDEMDGLVGLVEAMSAVVQSVKSDGFDPEVIDSAKDLETFAQVSYLAGWISQVFKDLQGKADHAILDQFPSGHTTTPDGWDIKVEPGALSRGQWDHPALLAKVLREASGLTPEQVEEAVKALNDSAYISYWRLRALRALGINADLHCEQHRGRPSVQVTPPGGGAE